MQPELVLLPLALAAFAFCAVRILRKFPAGAASVIWFVGLSALALLLVVGLLLLKQE